jgi:hypothetical protein
MRASYFMTTAWTGLATGDSNLNDVKFATGPNSLPGTWAFHNYIHEVGHLLGLKHAPLNSDKPWYGGVPEDHLAQVYTALYSANRLIGGDCR